ncbi:hypothetical protein Ciccas_006275 [Cichlidogyrus casuarinus]|uniref:Protein Red n=1 Tax=Cichlidogyrus casuarinus TaxID=1844966 RepID=A0ABD2Q683_9PLAT
MYKNPDIKVFDDLEVSATQKPLNNSDFRKLLSTAKSQPSQNDYLKSNAIRLDTRPEAKSKPFAPEYEAKKSKSKKHKHSGREHRHKESASSSVKDTSFKYRDRAKERREGKIVSVAEGVDRAEEEEENERNDFLRRTADYRAVAPTSISNSSVAERRKTIIEESKYLGGDIEHTHLVKGLDYVLLQKTRQKLKHVPKTDEDLDLELEKQLKSDKIEQQETKLKDVTKIENPMVAKLISNLFDQKPIERNELFLSGRMAFRVELEDDVAENEVPATLIRSKLEFPSLGLSSSLHDGTSTNEIVINKLTQILSYLRAGKRLTKKSSKRSANDQLDEVSRKDKLSKHNATSIFDDAPKEYVPTIKSKNEEKSRVDRKEKRSRYFQIKETEEEITEPAIKSFAGSEVAEGTEKANLDRLLKKSQVSGYDECYPGFVESYDAMGDSDEEMDLSKMDAGNKRGPVGKWDFDTPDEYNNYMSSKEALPKAAFQYGVKMNAGRKTRRVGAKDDKAQLDRQWNKIQNIIQKRSNNE